MFQVAIVLSTGKLNGTQIFSLITSVMSLSWGASRSFLILRPADKADPDPELMTVSLRIWPYVLDLGCSRSNWLEKGYCNFLLGYFQLFFPRPNLLSQSFPPNLFLSIPIFMSFYIFNYVAWLWELRNSGRGILKSKYVRMPNIISFHKLVIICKLSNLEVPKKIHYTLNFWKALTFLDFGISLCFPWGFVGYTEKI